MSSQGDYVAFEFSSTDAQTAAALTLKNADNTVITLLSTQRIIIDELFGVVGGTTTVVQVFDDKNGSGTINAGELIAAFTVGNVGGFIGGAEGFSVSLGSTPKVIATTAGTVILTGTGRIINGATQIGRQTWQSALKPG